MGGGSQAGQDVPGDPGRASMLGMATTWRAEYPFGTAGDYPQTNSGRARSSPFCLSSGSGRCPGRFLDAGVGGRTIRACGARGHLMVGVGGKLQAAGGGDAFSAVDLEPDALR
jgi:hypothetical protein